MFALVIISPCLLDFFTPEFDGEPGTYSPIKAYGSIELIFSQEDTFMLWTEVLNNQKCRMAAMPNAGKKDSESFQTRFIYFD
jgi:hypothetical protein